MHSPITNEKAPGRIARAAKEVKNMSPRERVALGLVTGFGALALYSPGDFAVNNLPDMITYEMLENDLEAQSSRVLSGTEVIEGEDADSSNIDQALSLFE